MATVYQILLDVGTQFNCVILRKMEGLVHQ